MTEAYRPVVSQFVRVLVVANPRATATSPRQRRVLLDALRQASDVVIEETANRGHAAALACRAMRERVDVVVALGGDGTVNEVVNGVLTDGLHKHVPAVGVVPAGSTNVFARALGLPNDPFEATGALLEALTANRRRHISLGRADDRWFLFAAGFGFDAAVVAAVERSRRKGTRSTHALYVRTALREYAAEIRKDPTITLQRPDGTEQPGLHLAIITNVSPWTFLGNRPITPTPHASFDNGLSLYARRNMGLLSLGRGLTHLVADDKTPSGRGVVVEEDLPGFVLHSSEPLPFQVDGDFLGDRTEVRFWGIRRALSVVV
ncbi:MAG: diacylglycerol kinase family lipid kinase [Pseudonocardiales bacterium]|nr:diacylglycerol kinase family lipid kinase [Pseudonocardiales bacterium]